MSRDRKYRKPPVVEALCEIYFAGSDWDDTVPGRYYERINSDFPEKRQVQVHEAEPQFSPSGEAAAGFRMAPRMQFRSQRGDRLIQLGRDLLVVNQLAPYPHFEDWEPAIYSALDVYRQFANPRGFVRLGLRYINRIVFPDPRVELEQYFTIYPRLPPGLGTDVQGFLVRIEAAQNLGHTVLLSFGRSTSARPEEVAILLDLYDILVRSPAGDLQDIEREVQAAHASIEAAFETSITDRLRALFEPETST